MITTLDPEMQDYMRKAVIFFNTCTLFIQIIVVTRLIMPNMCRMCIKFSDPLGRLASVGVDHCPSLKKH